VFFRSRFKPSRKPKPVPQSEAAAIGHESRDMSSQGAPHAESHVETGASSHKREDDSAQRQESGQR